MQHGQPRRAETGGGRKESSLVAEEYGRFDTYHGVTPDVFIIKSFTSAYVEHEHLKLVFIHIVV